MTKDRNDTSVAQQISNPILIRSSVYGPHDRQIPLAPHRVFESPRLAPIPMLVGPHHEMTAVAQEPSSRHSREKGVYCSREMGIDLDGRRIDRMKASGAFNASEQDEPPLSRQSVFSTASYHTARMYARRPEQEQDQLRTTTLPPLASSTSGSICSLRSQESHSTIVPDAERPASRTSTKRASDNIQHRYAVQPAPRDSAYPATRRADVEDSYRPGYSTNGEARSVAIAHSFFDNESMRRKAEIEALCGTQVHPNASLVLERELREVQRDRATVLLTGNGGNTNVTEREQSGDSKQVVGRGMEGRYEELGPKRRSWFARAARKMLCFHEE